MGLGQEDPPLNTAGARDLRPPGGQGQETWEGPPPGPEPGTCSRAPAQAALGPRHPAAQLSQDAH